MELDSTQIFARFSKMVLYFLFSLAKKMERKDYYSTIRELFCSYRIVDMQCLDKLHLQSFYLPQDDSTQPGRHMHIKPYTDFPWDCLTSQTLETTEQGAT